EGDGAAEQEGDDKSNGDDPDGEFVLAHQGIGEPLRHQPTSFAVSTKPHAEMPRRYLEMHPGLSANSAIRFLNSGGMAERHLSSRIIDSGNSGMPAVAGVTS